VIYGAPSLQNSSFIALTLPLVITLLAKHSFYSRRPFVEAFLDIDSNGNLG